jgi:hypothetical protein
MGEWPSQRVTDFRGRRLPEPAIPIGYAALIAAYDLQLPLPPRLAAIAGRHHPVATANWNILTPRHAVDPDLAAQLTFAIKWEGVDLGVLAQLFGAIAPAQIVALVQATPTGAFARRIWFLYEWLTGTTLDLADAGKVRMVGVLDPDQQFALVRGEGSTRHRVINNLPGTPDFCPMVWRSPALAEAAGKGLDAQARQQIGRVRTDLVARAAGFLLLSDSKSSFAIEGERPSGSRALRWGQAIAQAGTTALSTAELDRLQRIVIGDARFVRLGVRERGGFIGTHDRDTNDPLPDHISARAEDLESLLRGMIAFAERTLGGGYDPVAAAAALAFGFVYVHPYVDGNGRLHRWLIHHMLAAADYNPPGLVFPISAAILRAIEAYRSVLEGYSRPLLDMIQWRRTEDGNVEVLNDTAAYYRFFDATAHAAFLYACVEQTIAHDLPAEVAFLEAYDRFAQSVQEIVDMPGDRIELLEKFLRQGDGRLSKRARGEEFAALTQDESDRIEALYAHAFEK